jgi:hypothetical protein
MNQTRKDFFKMSQWALIGGIIGIVLGLWADQAGFYKNPFIEGTIRLISGTMDSIAEITFLLIVVKLAGRKSKASPYIYGTFIGTVIAPLTHAIIIKLGIDPYGPWGSIYAFAYSNSDNLFGSFVFLLWTIKQKRGFRHGLRSFLQEPFQVGNIISLALILILDVCARFIGFYPVKNVLAGIEAALMDADTVIASLFSITTYNKKQHTKV